MTSFDKSKPHHARVTGNREAQSLQVEALGQISNSISVLAIKENIFSYFTSSYILHLGESHDCEGLGQWAKKSQNNIIMAGEGMAGNLYLTDVLLEQF